MEREKLFEEVNFTYEYRNDMEEFYGNHFSSNDAMLEFFAKVFKDDNIDKAPRQMMNQVQRFVSLANDIDKIRPKRDPLRILFIKTCLEALCSISNMKKTDFYIAFPKYLSDEGKEYVLNNFSVSSFEDIYQGHQYEASHDLTIEDFFEIIKAIRDMVVHDGDYWQMQFFAYDTDSTWLATLETKKKILKSYKYQFNDKMNRIYHFSTTLQYDKFVFYFVEACINFINDYISRKEAETNNEKL